MLKAEGYSPPIVPERAHPPVSPISSSGCAADQRNPSISINQHARFLEVFFVSDNIVHVSDADFDSEVLNADQPVLVDYWAEWCGPCKMIAPILEEVAGSYEGQLKIAKLNIDENPETPPKFGIRGIPTLMLFKNGSVEATKVGALSKAQLSAFLDSNL
jgi:thioredoxin 1